MRELDLNQRPSGYEPMGVFENFQVNKGKNKFFGQPKATKRRLGLQKSLHQYLLLGFSRKYASKFTGLFGILHGRVGKFMGKARNANTQINQENAGFKALKFPISPNFF